MTELLLERTENETTPNAGVAVDVRRLISQVEGGTQFDVEWTGHAYDVCADACAALAARLGQASLGQGLAAEIEGRIERFARSTSTSNMYLRLVITDKMPDLPDYAPCQISVYDGTRSNGTDFSKVIQRATIYGTLMTSVNVTDLKAYFEGGRKRHLLVYLGTDRMGDIKALDKMLAAMPAMLQAAGLDAGAIKEMIAAVKAGNMPPAAIKMLHQMIEIGQLRIAQAQAPLSRAEQAALTKLETVIASQLQSPAFLKSMPAIFTTALRAVATAPMRVASPTMRTTPLADNDNKTVSPKDVATLVTALRALARDKTIPAAQRSEIAAILLDLRAGTKITNPAPARIIAGITKLDAIVKTATATAVKLPAYILAIAAPLANITAPRYTPAVLKNMIAEIRALARDKTIPLSERREMAAALLDLRAGTKAVNPVPARAALGVARVSALLADAKTAPAIIAKLAAPLMKAHMASTHVIQPMPSADTVASMITAIRTMARDKEISPAQRREMAAALLDLRAGTKAANPVQARAALGVARVTALLADAKTAPAITARLAMPLILARVASRSTVSEPSNAAALSAMMKAIRTMARDKTIDPAQRREMAAALRDLRAAEKVVTTTPVQNRAATAHTETPASNPYTPPKIAENGRGLLEASAPPSHGPAEPARIALVLNHMASAIRADTKAPQLGVRTLTIALTAVTPKAMDLFKPVFTAMLDNKALPPQTRTAISRAIETGKPDTMVRLITDNPNILEGVPPQIIAKALESIKPSDITPPNTAKVDELKGTLKTDIAKEKPSGPQYNADGTLKDCCTEFGKAVAIKGALEAIKNDDSKKDPSNPPSNPQQPPKPEWKLEDDGSIKVIGKKGEIETITAVEVNRNIEGHKKLDADLANAQSTSLVPDKPQWSDDTSRMLSQLNAPPKGSDMKTIFTHICGPGCNHGADSGFKADAVPVTPTGQMAAREIEVELVRVAEVPAKQPTSRAPKRSMRPA